MIFNEPMLKEGGVKCTSLSISPEVNRMNKTSINHTAPLSFKHLLAVCKNYGYEQRKY